jgi:hypothetical protein
MSRALYLLLGLVLWMDISGAATAQDAAYRGPMAYSNTGKPTKLPMPVNLESLPAHVREALLKVMQSPTITAVAPAEEFCASGDTYLWLLDHPDRVSLAWRRLNIGAVDICPADGGCFNWKDEQGSELTWKTISKNGEGRIWYAEGKVRPATLLPIVPVRAVAVLRHGTRKKEDDGNPVIKHQLEVFLQTDSKMAGLVLRMLGPAAPRMAEQGSEQLLLFFSGIARYVEKNPSKAAKLLAEKK